MTILLENSRCHFSDALAYVEKIAGRWTVASSVATVACVYFGWDAAYPAALTVCTSLIGLFSREANRFAAPQAREFVHSIKEARTEASAKRMIKFLKKCSDFLGNEEKADRIGFFIGALFDGNLKGAEIAFKRDKMTAALELYREKRKKIMPRDISFTIPAMIKFSLDKSGKITFERGFSIIEADRFEWRFIEAADSSFRIARMGEEDVRLPLSDFTLRVVPLR